MKEKAEAHHLLSHSSTISVKKESNPPFLFFVLECSFRRLHPSNLDIEWTRPNIRHMGLFPVPTRRPPHPHRLRPTAMQSAAHHGASALDLARLEHHEDNKREEGGEGGGLSTNSGYAYHQSQTHRSLLHVPGRRPRLQSASTATMTERFVPGAS